MYVVDFPSFSIASEHGMYNCSSLRLVNIYIDPNTREVVIVSLMSIHTPVSHSFILGRKDLDVCILICTPVGHSLPHAPVLFFSLSFLFAS